jgi:hypothetical protein
MKKIYALFISLTVLGAKAQLTEANHAPSAGNNYETYQCDSLGINPGPSGAGVMWTFTASTHSNIVTSYTSLAANNPQYPAAKIGVVSSTSNTSYYSSDVNAAWYYGGNISIPPVKATMNYTAPAIYGAYPMALNTTSSAVTGGSINLTSPLTTSGTFTGSSNVLVDGTGTLTIDNLVYTNIYRVVSTQTISFTVQLGNGSVVQKTYEYFQPGIKPSLYTIASATVVTSLGTSTQVIVTRFKPLPNNTGIPELQAGEALSVYPNPAINEVHFLAMDKNLVLSLFDITGKTVLVKEVTNGHLKLDVSSLVKGLYIYSVASPDGAVVKSGKLTVIQ